MIDLAFPGNRIRHYMRTTGRSGKWIQQQHYIALIYDVYNDQDLYMIDFFKSRNDEVMLAWCKNMWGPPRPGGEWWQEGFSSLRLMVRGQERIMHWQMTWE